jgi:hypothetical protein
MARLYVLLILAVLLAACATPVPPASVSAALSPAPQSSANPVKVEGNVKQALLLALQRWDLDTARQLTVATGVSSYLSANPGTELGGWEVYYNRDTVAGSANRRLYWAVARFHGPQGPATAIISVEGLAGSTPIYMPWEPCNDLADVIMSRIFGGPSYGTSTMHGSRCTTSDGRWVGDVIR